MAALLGLFSSIGGGSALAGSLSSAAASAPELASIAGVGAGDVLQGGGPFAGVDFADVAGSFVDSKLGQFGLNRGDLSGNPFESTGGTSTAEKFLTSRVASGGSGAGASTGASGTQVTRPQFTTRNRMAERIRSDLEQIQKSRRQQAQTFSRFGIPTFGVT